MKSSNRLIWKSSIGTPFNIPIRCALIFFCGCFFFIVLPTLWIYLNQLYQISRIFYLTRSDSEYKKLGMLMCYLSDYIPMRCVPLTRYEMANTQKARYEGSIRPPLDRSRVLLYKFPSTRPLYMD